MALVIPSFATIVVVQPGDNLFRIAMLYLGDATQWNRIAQLNLALLGGVADPFIPPGQPLSLRMPLPKSNAGGGIYG